MRLELVPVTLTEAKRFVNEHHRHNEAPLSWNFGVGLAVEGELVGVAMAGRPSSRWLDADARSLEVTRVCTLGERNANTRLYGAICRAAEALGYLTVRTYTLAEEDGASLRAAGFVLEAELPPRPSWSTPSRTRYDETLFGPRKRPPGAKLRWRRDLGARARVVA